MREFLELTEQSQKLQIQFQHVSFIDSSVASDLMVKLT